MEKEYLVNYSIICRYSVKVEAEDDEQAIELADAKFETADFGELEYGSHSVDAVEL